MVTLTITLDETTGAVNVTGPLSNKVACYGLLGCARDTIQQYQAPSSSILPVGNITLPHLHRD